MVCELDLDIIKSYYSLSLIPGSFIDVSSECFFYLWMGCQWMSSITNSYLKGTWDSLEFDKQVGFVLFGHFSSLLFRVIINCG